MHSASLALPCPAAASGRAAWYCVQVRRMKEDCTARNLRQRIGVPVFAPRIRAPAAPRPAVRPATEALFPGYVFARFVYPDQARHIASTPGVLGLVAFGGPPPAVGDRVIEHLATEVRQAAATAVEPAYPPGGWVRIVCGCFRGSEGRVIQSAGDRVGVLLNLLGQPVQVSLPSDQLMSATGAASRLPAGLRAGEPTSSPAGR